MASCKTLDKDIFLLLKTMLEDTDIELNFLKGDNVAVL